MKVLLVGAGGNIGSEVEPALIRHGHEVIPLRRSGASGGINADFSDAAGFKSAVANIEFDAAICMLGMNARDAVLMQEVCRPKGAHLIWTSTVCVFGGPLQNGMANDQSERRPISAYGNNKMQAEDILLAEAGTLPTTIVRPASTGNAAFPILRQLSVTNSWLDRIRAQKPIAVGGNGEQHWSWSTARDVAEGYALTVGDERAFGKAYTITRPEPITWNDWHRGVADVMGKPIGLVHVPVQTVLASDVPHGLLEEQSQWDQIYSPADFQKDFPEWEVRDTFEDAIRTALKHQKSSFDPVADKAENMLITRGFVLDLATHQFPRVRKLQS